MKEYEVFLEEALYNIKDAIEACIEVLRKHGLDLQRVEVQTVEVAVTAV